MKLELVIGQNCNYIGLTNGLVVGEITEDFISEVDVMSRGFSSTVFGQES